MHDVDTALLRTFLSLAETGSFSRTGDLVGRSQSAVSAQIRKLEETFGCSLFSRDTRNVAMTAEGERLLGHARAMVAEADAMLARFRGKGVQGSVRFGSPEDFASHYLPDVLAGFAKAHPGVELHVTCQLTLPLAEAFAAGEFDLAVVKQDPRQPFSGARALWREELVWVAMPGFRVEAGRPVPLVLSPAPCVYRARAMRALEGARQSWTGVFVSPSFAGAVAAVRAGLGAMAMPKAMVPTGLAVLKDWPALDTAEIAVLAPARPAPAAQALLDFIAERVRR